MSRNDMNPIDLQIQTTASDGKLTPRECVELAKKNGLTTIAITDHDTIFGVAEALAAGKEFGVEVIPGVEMSAEGHNIHILGFGITLNNPALNAALEDFKSKRLSRGKQLVENLRHSGLVVEWEDVLREAKDAIITSPHIVDAVMKRPENKEKLKGVITKHDFYKKLFSHDGPNYVQLKHVSAETAIELIHGAGGVAIWSHPPVPDFIGKCTELVQFFKELRSYGLDGIELYGTFLTDVDFACLNSLVASEQILVSAGSDFHELHEPSSEPWPRSAGTIGEYPTFGRSLDAIVPMLRSRISRRNVA